MTRAAVVLVAACALADAACGKKGPPLPPLVRLPVAPTEVVASRRGLAVDIEFTVPRANTDGSTPADLARVEVYALEGSLTLTPDEILRRGTRVGSVVVNTPPDPDAPSDAPVAPGPNVRTNGADQGKQADVPDSLTETRETLNVRHYVVLGISERGRRGPVARTAVPLVPAPPPPPSPPVVAYDEKATSLVWEPPAAGELPWTFHVYETGDEERRLTAAPVDAPRFDAPRADWGATRCYAVRTVIVVESARLESEATPSACVTLRDTFPPAAPGGVRAVTSDGAVDLIWEANADADLAGYNVLRAIAPETRLTATNTVPLTEPTFRDAVPPGSRVTYAIQAIDKAGNVSEPSTRVEQTVR